MSLLYRTIQSHVRDFESNLYTSVPAKVISFDPVECTVEVQPSINEIDADGIVRVLPELGRVPLLMPNALNSALTFPVKEGDKVLLHFCQSNVEDYLLQSTEENPDDITPNTKRKHDLDDCFATLGVRFYDDSPVRVEDTLDLYYGNTRLNVQEDGTCLLELHKMSEGDNPETIHKQYLKMDQTGDTTLVYEKDDIRTEVTISNNGRLEIKNNQHNSNIVLDETGNISATTKSKFSVNNDSIELVSLLSDLINTLANTTVNTYYGPSPLNSKPQLQNLKSQLDTMKV